jgi:hypothetical protein
MTVFSTNEEAGERLGDDHELEVSCSSSPARLRWGS